MESERAMLAHRASHDTLTAMPNRAAFDEQLARRIEAAAQRGAGLALLFIDGDQFKTANDNFGHAAGDGVLVLGRALVRERVLQGVEVWGVGLALKKKGKEEVSASD